MNKQLLDFLKSDEVLHANMMFCINRNTVQIIYSDIDCVFLRDTVSGVYMLSSKNIDKAKELIDKVGKQYMFCVQQKAIANYLKEQYKYPKQMVCYQAVYNKKEHLCPNSNILDIKPLTIDYLDTVCDNYHNGDREYMEKRINSGNMFGGFLNGELCGFIGNHEEGSIGILEVLPQFRRRGFAVELESYMVNRTIDQNQIPFVQIETYNEVSVELHKKLGFLISNNMIYWLFSQN